MKKIWLWIKNNKLAAALLVLAAFLLAKNSIYSSLLTKRTTSSTLLPVTGGRDLVGFGASPSSLNFSKTQETAPSTSQERLVIETSNLSLVADDVEQTSQKIIEKTKELGGFMVEVSLTKPEESPLGTIIVRVPEGKKDEALNYFRSLAVKVSSERVLGRDVTDQYEDIGERLATLAKTKVKFEEILEKAEKVDDILRVQRELISLQSQIDSLKGRQEYLEKSAALTKITIYLSSDELALPYQPQGAFRPKVIFKQAVRSLVKTLRGIAKLFIWLAVYSPIWGGALVIIFAIKWFKKRKKKI